MIISHSKQFIFLKPRKTASTSVEIALSTFCTQDDIVTKISPQDEVMRQHIGGQPGKDIVKSLNEWTLKDCSRLMLRQKMPKRLVNHEPAASVRKYVGEEMWNSYTKISMERNPWDKFISMYYWNIRNLAVKPTMLDYLNTIKDNTERLSNWNIYAIGDQVCADIILRYEHINEDLAQLAEQLNLGGLKLPNFKAKSGIRPITQKYQEVITPELNRELSKICRREIHHFKYALNTRYID
ncbi:sulfotransferase family 2 domain-containing protein [Planktomarina temperata]|nr:sulfotransferase family 2 domain-containing protein [Planktomarina temperata]